MVRNLRITIEMKMIRNELKRLDYKFTKVNSEVTRLLRVMDRIIVKQKDLRQRLDELKSIK